MTFARRLLGVRINTRTGGDGSDTRCCTKKTQSERALGVKILSTGGLSTGGLSAGGLSYANGPQRAGVRGQSHVTTEVTTTKILIRFCQRPPVSFLQVKGHPCPSYRSEVTCVLTTGQRSPVSFLQVKGHPCPSYRSEVTCVLPTGQRSPVSLVW
uniref:Uncharacterized protein n=1 Tax=Knipowitschia caucasica TaxID=637954 RepID=A0AAV2KRT4_KNICA